MANRQMVIRAGDSARVIRSRTSSIPRTFHLETESLGGGTVSGAVAIHGSRWLFAKPPSVVPLEPRVTVHRGFWDTLFSVYVTPDQDVRITIC